jgi:hypothetical protein
MTENEDELMQLLGGNFLSTKPEADAAQMSEVADAPHPGRGLDFAADGMLEQLTATPAAAELPALGRVLRLLPAEDRAEALEIAQALQINQDSDELLYSILVGLGYHKTVIAGIPDKVIQSAEMAVDQFSQAANSASNSIEKAISESASDFIAGANVAQNEIQEVVKLASNQIQLAANKGAQQAIQNFDVTPIAEQIAIKTENGLAKKWFAKAMIAASVASVFLVLVGGYGGYKLAGIGGNNNSNTGSNYLNQLQCGNTVNGVLACRDQFGGIVKFKTN